MSFDQIGVIGLDVESCELVFDVIKGRDENDAISKDYPNKTLQKNNLKVGILRMKADDKIWKLVDQKIEKVHGNGSWKKDDVKLNYPLIPPLNNRFPAHLAIFPARDHRAKHGEYQQYPKYHQNHYR